MTSAHLKKGELLPQLVGQPAISERTCMSQLQPTQPYLDVIHCIARQSPVLGKQTRVGIVLPVFIKHRQSLAPAGFLLVDDLAQIQHCALHCLMETSTSIMPDSLFRLE